MAFLQASVDEAGRQFREHVTMGRASAGVTLNDEVWRAGWYSGETAMDLGLIDGVATLDEANEFFLKNL
jgi:ClpP class serine protease